MKKILFLTLSLSFFSYYAQDRLPTIEVVNAKTAKAHALMMGWKPAEIYRAITGPEQDCGSAIPLCAASYTETNSYTGIGGSQEVNGTCLGPGETNSVWYMFTVASTGTFAFNIATANDYDFALYDITTIGCAGVPTAAPVRCNFSGTSGNTGLILPTSATIPLTVGAAGSPTMPGLNVTAGQEYALIINNWSSDDNGYTITFSGTASIFDATPPAMSAVASCYTNDIFVTMDENILCSSINIADFKLTNTSTSTDFTSAITTITGVNCGTYTDQLEISHDGSLTSGSYEIRINPGPTLSDACGNLITAGTILNFDYCAPISLSPNVSTTCNSGDPVTITTNGGPSGQTYTLQPGSVSNTTGIFNINPVSTTTYSVSVTFGGCTRVANTTITVQDNVVVSVSPIDPTVCSGNATLTATATVNGAACPTCTFLWSTTATTASISAPAGSTYTVDATTTAGCASDNTASSTVSLASAGGGASCDVLYVSTAGGGDGLTKTNPTDLQSAITAALCTNTIIKMATGNYNYGDRIIINSYVTIEGGYDATYTTKTSDLSSGNATTLIRSNVVDSDAPGECTLFDVVTNADAFRLQDLRIEMPTTHAANSGVTNYAIKLGSNAQNFNIVRCYIDAGTGANGSSGTTTVNYTTPGTDTWTCPSGVTSATITVYGAGGGGGGNTATTDGGGGGGGGGSSQSVLAVTPSTVYNLNVGLGGSGGVGLNNGNPGGQSWFNNATTVQANGGSGGLLADANGGQGGNGGAAGIGTSTYTGGNGANGRDHNTGRGGGGGGGAGSSANGSSASGSTSTYSQTAGAGGATGGGNGGDGGDAGLDGSNGSTIGGGGGGSGDTGTRTGGNGANGQVTVSYTANITGGSAYAVYGLTDVQTNGGSITDCQFAATGGSNGGVGCWLCDPADDGISGKNLTGQPVISIENYNCTNTDIDFVKTNATTLGDAAPTGYCASTYTNQTDDWITNVTFNTINNTSGQNGASSYGDYTAQTTNVTQGATYNLSVSFSSGGFTEHVFAWFDWNQNGSFADAGESYDLGQGSSTTLNMNITVPGTAILGATRFRITEQWNTNPGPCNAHPTTFGETEDYICVVYSSGAADWSDLGVNETATLPSTLATLTSQYTTGSFGRKDVTLVGAGTGNISQCGAQTWTSNDGRAIGNNLCETANSLVIPAQSCTYTGDQLTIGVEFTGSGTCWAIYLITPYGDIIDLEYGNTPGWSNGNITFNDAGAPQGLTGGTNTGNFKPNGGSSTWCTQTPNKTTLAGINGGTPFNMGGTWQLRATRGACAPGAATFVKWSISVPAATSNDGTTYPVYAGFGNITMDKPSSGTVIGSNDVCVGTYNFASSEAGTPGYTYSWSCVDPAGGVSSIASSTASSTNIGFTNTTGGDLIFPVKLLITSECCGPLTEITYNVTVNPTPANPTVPVTAPTNCEGGQDTLVATAAAGISYSWFDAATGGTLLGTGAQYIVPSTPNGTTSYFVEAISSDGCVSTGRTQVDLTSTNVAPTTIDATHCAPGLLTVSISAPISGASYFWYDAAAGGNLMQSGNATSHDVNVPTAMTISRWVSVISAAGCSESGRTIVDARVLTAPASTTWSGALDNDWFKSGNWSDCVPTCDVDAIIPAATPDCQIDFGNGGIANCKSISIAAGEVLKFMDNKAVLEVCGNFNHNGNVDMAGIGKISFVSSVAAQTYTKSGTGTGDLHIVEINNTSGTPTVTVASGAGNQDMSIGTSGQLMLTSGILTTGGTLRVDVKNASTAAISGHSTSSFVNGKLNREIQDAGATNSYDFPVGTATSYNLATYNFNQSTISGGLTDLEVSFADGAVGTGLTIVDANTIFYTGILNNGGGTAGIWTATPNAGAATYDVTLNGRDFSNGGVNHTVLKRDNAGTAWGWGGSTVGSQNVTATVITTNRTGYTAFSQFAIARTATALPVELLSFTATLNNKVVELTWETANEINNDYFTIMRSDDAIDWTAILRVEGAGNSNQLIHYFDIDQEPLTGKSYYRIVQTDFDGEVSVSNIVPINNFENEDDLKVYPNPSNGNNFILAIDGFDGKDLLIVLRDINGRELFSKITLAHDRNGVMELVLDRELPPGNYLIIASSDDNMISKKLQVR